MKLIRYITLHIGDPEEERRRILDELFMDEGFSRWVEAYNMFLAIGKDLYETLLDLDDRVSSPENECLLGKLRKGFLEAEEAGFDIMKKKLRSTKSADPERLEKKVNMYLPEDTPLKVDVIFTIDSFNTGMMREDTVYYSVLHIDPEHYDPLRLAHEVHHIGVYHWFRRDEKWRKWYLKENTPERIASKLLIYIVSEGAANSLMSPTAVAVWDVVDDRTLVHNKRIRKLERKYRDYLQMIEDIILSALAGDIEKSRDAYRELSLDVTGAGVPAGHYTSARMFQEILSEHEETIVKTIIKNPWNFFSVYNKTEANSHLFSKEFVSFFQS